MILKITKQQLLAVKSFLDNLKKLVDKGYGSVSGVMILSNKATPNVVYVKYERSFVSGGEPDYENRIVSIDSEGKLELFDTGFKDVFERAAFIADCKNVNLDDQSSFELI